MNTRALPLQPTPHALQAWRGWRPPPLPRASHTRALHLPIHHQAEKRPLIEELRLPFRDAVMVNPLVPTPYPPAILIRDCALVLNLGALRACVGADRVILLSIPDASSEHWAFPTPGGRFERELAARLAGLSPTLGGNGGLGEGPPPPALPSAGAALDAPAASGADLLAAGAALASPPPPPGALPFELRALEACLAEALADLSAEAAAVAERTLPALELLADGVAVTRRGLEAVRGSKLAIKRLEARINGLKRELEEIINDDDDMRDMLLTFRKGLSEGLAAATAAAEAAAAAAAATGATTDEEKDEEGTTEGSLASDEARPPLARRSLSPASTLRRRTPAGGAALAGPLERLASAGWAPVPLEPGTLAEAPEEEEEGAGGEGRAGQQPSRHPSHTHTHHATTHPPVVRAASHHDVAACESMLESYFMQADFLLSRLFVLRGSASTTRRTWSVRLKSGGERARGGGRGAAAARTACSLSLSRGGGGGGGGGGGPLLTPPLLPGHSSSI